MRGYSIIVEMTYGVFWHCATFLKNVVRSKCTPFTFINVLGMKEAFCQLKATFSTETFYRQKLSDYLSNFPRMGFLFPVGGKVVFESYRVSLRLFSGTLNLINF